MAVRIGINGFGRIGRSVLRVALQHYPDCQIVAINDLVSPKNLAYLCKHDTIHGRLPYAVSYSDDALSVNGQEILVYSQKDPSQLPWGKHNIDFVIESTGLFTHKKEASKHLEAGARYVVISAPPKDAVPIFVMGVNHTRFNPKTDAVVSNASCTTNALAPMAKVLLDSFGIEEGLMTTVHAITASQPSQDGPSHKDFRGGRSAFFNTIPASTGAAKAVTKCLPALEGKLTGMAFRVPVSDVSVVDLTVRLTKPTEYDTIFTAMQEASQGHLKNILSCTEEAVVSSDFIGDRHSCIFDRGAGIALNKNFFKLIGWYDNEIGYSARLLDLILYMASKN